MSRIELTKKEEEQLVGFREECLQIGLSTEPIKRDIITHRENVNFIYKEYLKLPPPTIWYVDSPLQLNIVRNLFFDNNLQDNLEDNLQDNLWANLWAKLQENLRANLWDNIWANLQANLRDNLQDNLEAKLWANLEDNLQDNLRNNLWDKLRANLEANIQANLEANIRDKLEAKLWANLRDNLQANIRDNIRDNLQDNLWANLEANLEANLKFENIHWSNMDIYWLAFYIFPEKYLGINYGHELSHNLNKFYNFVKTVGYFWCFKNVIFISDRPTKISKKGIQLHCSDGPSVEFKDKYAIYTLNGVNVPKEIVMTPAALLNPELVLKEKNAEVRREIVRKIGVERICNKLNAKCIDKQDNYELLLLDLQDGEKRPYLKMINPSIGTYHIEGVHPDCNTVEEALNFRNGTTEKPKILT